MKDVVIVGGGLAGLTCAVELEEAGVPYQLFDAADELGGRVRTDVQDGFRLDRGFQVLLTAYPEVQATLDVNALNLCRFEPGALVRLKGKFHRFADPWRRPRHLLKTAFSPVGTLMDKIRVARLRRGVCRGSLAELFERPEVPTIGLLRDFGFSETMIERFFRPFLGGVFLENELATSSRMFEFVFRMFSLGDAAVPAEGMQAIPRQLASRLDADRIHLRRRATGINQQDVHLDNGETITGSAVVVATDAINAARLLGHDLPPAGRSVKCLYYAADQSPLQEAILVLDGDGRSRSAPSGEASVAKRGGPINNLCVPSDVSSAYAPEGRSLISASVVDGVDDDNLESCVRSQLKDWFGSDVEKWDHLSTCHVEFALPDQTPPALTPVEKPVERADRLYVCGDHTDTASIQGAMVSGKRAAAAIVQKLQRD